MGNVVEARPSGGANKLMIDAVDPRLAAIERVVRETALKLWARDQTVAEIVAKLTVVGAMPVDITPRDGAAAVRQSRRKAMLAELERIEQEGRGSAAAM